MVEALADTQLAFLRGDVRESGSTPVSNRWRHPYFWAAATFAGQDGELNLRIGKENAPLQTPERCRTNNLYGIHGIPQRGRPGLRPRFRRYQVIRAVVNHKLAEMFCAVLDARHPDI